MKQKIAHVSVYTVPLIGLASEQSRERWMKIGLAFEQPFHSTYWWLALKRGRYCSFWGVSNLLRNRNIRSEQERCCFWR